jgi:hypothetical protein
LLSLPLVERQDNGPGHKPGGGRGTRGAAVSRSGE